MTIRTHTCAAVGCQHVITTRMLMCVDHWRQVPAPLRREVLQAWKGVWAGEQGMANKHRDAVARAVAAVKLKQERKAHGGPSGGLFNG